VQRHPFTKGKKQTPIYWRNKKLAGLQCEALFASCAVKQLSLLEKI
jgi:hypothetical protein